MHLLKEKDLRGRMWTLYTRTYMKFGCFMFIVHEFISCFLVIASLSDINILSQGFKHILGCFLTKGNCPD